MKGSALECISIVYWVKPRGARSTENEVGLIAESGNTFRLYPVQFMQMSIN